MINGKYQAIERLLAEEFRRDLRIAGHAIRCIIRCIATGRMAV
jgi:hypothetical protein